MELELILDLMCIGIATFLTLAIAGICVVELSAGD